MAYYLVVKDNDLKTYATNYTQFISRLEQVSDVYIQIMSNVLERGIVSGKRHDYLSELKAYAELLSEMLPEIGIKSHELITGFLEEIEAADRELYDSSAEVRDYTEGHYFELQKELREQKTILEKVLSKGLYLMANFVLGQLGYVGKVAKEKLEPTLEELIKENEETEDGLKAMFDMVHEIDQQYGSHMLELESTMKEVEEVILAIGRAMNSANIGKWDAACLKQAKKALDRFTVQYDQAVIGLSNQEELDKLLDRSMTIDAAGNKILINPTPGFDGVDDKSITGPFYEEYDSFEETWKEYLFNIDGALKDWLKSVFRDEKINDAWGDGEFSYEDYLEMQQIKNTIDDMKKSSDELKEYKEDLKNYRTVLGLYQQYGEEAYKYLNTHRDDNHKLLLDGRTKEAKEFLKQLKGIENAQKILKAGEKGVEYLSIILANRDQEKRIISSLSQTVPENSDCQKAIKRLEILYNNKVIEIGEKVADDVSEFSVETIEKSLDMFVPVFSGIDKLGELTGLGDQAKAAYNAKKISLTLNSARTAYENAIKEYQASDHDSAVATKVTDTYEFYKKTLERMYTEMANATTGDKKAYYQYCTSRVKSMSMSKDVKLMSYSDFTHQNIYEGTSQEKPVCGI